MGHEGHDPDHSHPHPHHHHHAHPHGHDSKSAAEHKAHAPAHVSVSVITCSDSRDARSDETGALIATALERAGHSVAGRTVVADDAEAIRRAVAAAADAGARAVILNGGTGIGRRDVTVETVQALFDKSLPGFGELFRALSFQEIGSAAMMSRAVAGTHRGMIVFALPGSPQAVRVALERLILPELGHAVRELTR